MHTISSSAAQPQSPNPLSKELQVRRGVWLSITECRTEAERIWDYTDERPAIHFGFTLNGQLRNSMKSPCSSPLELQHQKGSAGILYLPERSGKVHIPGNTHLQQIHVHVLPETLDELICQEEEVLPDDLRRTLKRNSSLYCNTGQMSNRTASCLQDLLAGVPSGMAQSLFYEAIVLQLIACQLMDSGRRATERPGLTQHQTTKIREAAAILAGNITSPPSIRELSRIVGLNCNKMQEGFRQLYGMSVYQYLGTCRMQQALQLFHVTDMNVSEVAVEVGYTNISHFSAAFRRAFETLPKKYLQKIRNSR